MKKRFITQFIVTLTVVCIIATVAYFFICKGLRQANRDSIGKFNYILYDTTYYNNVFFGSSTTHTGINPFIFDSLNGTHSFNAGMDGVGIAELNMLIHKYVKSHGAPCHIFIGLDELTLAMEKRVWYFPQYYPFADDTDLKELVMLEPKLRLGKYLPAVAVTYFDDPLKNLALIGLLKDNKQKEYVLTPGGANPIKNKKMSENAERKATYYKGSKHGWELLEQTIAECRSKNIAISFILLPRYNCFLSDSSAPFKKRLKKFESDYGIKTFTYSADTRFTSKDLFFDRTHLNAEGADLFAAILAKEVSAPADK